MEGEQLEGGGADGGRELILMPFRARAGRGEAVEAVTSNPKETEIQNPRPVGGGGDELSSAPCFSCAGPQLIGRDFGGPLLFYVTHTYIDARVPDPLHAVLLFRHPRLPPTTPALSYPPPSPPGLLHMPSLLRKHTRTLSPIP